MQRIVLICAATATTLAASLPAAAQTFDRSNYTITRPAAFIGAQARLTFGSKERAVPVARLTAGMANLSFNSTGELVNRSSGSNFELGFSRSGRADFYVAGQRVSDMKIRLGIAPLGVAMLAVGGLAVVGASLAGSGSSESSSEQKKKPEVVCLGIGVCPTL